MKIPTLALNLILLSLYDVEGTGAPKVLHEHQDISSNHLDYAFETYVSEFHKSYDSEEDYLRHQETFLNNMKKIQQHNADVGSKFVMGVNQFTDLEDHEMPTGHDKSHHPAFQPVDSLTESGRMQLKNKLEIQLPNIELDDLPKAVDWRTNGQVTTPVKNQGKCGSCWAFASTAVLESHIAIQTGKLFSLSMQELVSCAPNPHACGGTGGCTGSTAELAFDFVAKHGMVEEFNFGYQSYHGDKVNCTILPTKESRNLRKLTADEDMASGAVASILGFTTLPTNQYKALMIAVATMGPVSVSVAASGWGLYAGGIYDDDKSETRVINHAVVLEGYGTDEETGQDYWLIRNSWGPMWGENGYIRLKRVDPASMDDPQADCKLDDKPADGIACTKDDTGKDIVPPKVSVCGTSGVLFDSAIPVGGHLV